MSRNELPEMIATVEPLNAGFCLKDADDVRHQYITTLRRRYGEFLHTASASLRQQGEENTVDAVHMLVSIYMIHFQPDTNNDGHKDTSSSYLHA
jgi:proteasome activator subunit 4